MPSLINIPGLGGYIQGQQLGQQQALGQLQQAQGLIGILSAVQQQQQREQAMQREAQFRSELGQAATPEQQAMVALKYGAPKDIITSQATQARINSNNQIALARLDQMKSSADMAYKLKFDAARSKAEQDAINNDYKAFNAQLAAARARYETGASVNPPMMPLGQPMQAPAAPAGVDQPTPQVPAGQAMRTIAPTIEAAMQQFKTGGGVPRTVDITGTGGVLPSQVAQAPASSVSLPPELANAPQKVKDQYMLKKATGAASERASDATVEAIAQGRMAMPSGWALRSPYWQDVVERVQKINPQFDATVFGARQAARRTFASGPEARNVTALNTVIGHLGTLDEAAGALQNGDLRAFNAVANRLATETGDPRVQNFDTAKQAVAEETMRVFRQVGASETEARMWGERITSSGSPAQLRGVIATLGKLLDSRVEAIGQQYERTVNQTGNPAKVDPANRTQLDRLIQQGAAPKEGQTGVSKSGKPTIFRNGRWEYQ